MQRRLTLLLSCLLASAASAETVVRITEVELRRRFEIVVAAPFPKIEYRGPRDFPLRSPRGPVEGSLDFTTWTTSGSSTFQREMLDLSVRETTIGIKGWTASTDLSTWIWSVNPSNRRFRPGSDVQFYLYEAKITNQSSRSPWVVSAGRFRPWNIPGVGMLDGAQAGWRVGSHRTEVGVYGGTYGDMITLAPEHQAWTGGAYFERSYVESRDLLLRQELRIGLRHTPEFGSRFEGQTVLFANVKRLLDLSLDLAAGLGNGTVSDPSLDALRFDAGYRPLDRLRIYAGVRLLERQASEIDLPTPDGSRRGDLSAIYQFSPTVSLALNGGVASQIGGFGGDRWFVGPEVRWRNISAGYQEESGWISGRLLYVAPTFTFAERHRLIVRGSVSQERGADLSQTEWSFFSALQSRILQYLALRLSAQFIGGDTPFGFVGGFELTGQI